MNTKKLGLLLLLSLLCTIHLYAQNYNKQNTYLDALMLANICKSIPEDNKDTIVLIGNFEAAFGKIIHKFGTDEELLENPFLKNHMLGIVSFDSILVGGSYGPGSKFIKPKYKGNALTTSAVSAANWQSSVINGVANFMAGRFKQEALHIAINQMFRQIKKKEDSILVKAIFPKTFKQIGNLYGGGNSSYYTADLLLLRQTAQIDIEQFPQNLSKNAAAIFPALDSVPKIKDMLTISSSIVAYSQEGQPLNHLLTLVANENYSSDSTIYKIINTADLISQALIDTANSGDIWINPKLLLPATTKSFEQLEVRYFYGLLYQQLIQIPEFKNYLAGANTDNMVMIASKIQNLSKFVNQLNRTYHYLKTKEFDLNSSEEIINYIKEINQSIAFFIHTLKEIPEINNRYNISDEMIDIPKRYINLFEALIKKDYQKTIPILLIEFGDYMGTNKKTTRTIAFVSQLATIESADDMEALLSAYALPIGSASIKRHSKFNLSVNGYVGITAGWETAYGSIQNQTKGNIGLSAPIGISTTFCNGYLTSFLSIIDLGSVVNQRLNNDTNIYSNLRFEQFFSPGVGLFVNFPKLPISAGLNFSYIPNLRTIKYNNGTATITETNRSVSRINFSLLVDMPFFTLYNKDKRR